MPKLLRFAIAVIIAIATHQTAASQSLSVNTTGAAADPSAILDVSSTAKGVLVPRMDKTQKTAIATPANGLQFPVGTFHQSNTGATTDHRQTTKTN